MDEDEGHTINDDLRMMGLEGDDEDSMEEDRLALFVQRSAGRRENVEVIMPPPVAVGGAGAASGPGATGGAGAAAGATGGAGATAAGG